MGLDQTVNSMSKETAEIIRQWQSSDDMPEPDQEVWDQIEEVWRGRKENHIQAFMEDKVGAVENCQYLFLNKSNIANLVGRLAAVSKMHDMASELLPTQEGFFFGGTEYDDWYFQDVERELKEFTEILDTWDDDRVYAYWAWW